MKLAEVLSDLNTLRVCDHSAALALVSARPTPPSKASAPEAQTKREGDEDPDLQRAKDLLRLHNDVKVAHEHGRVDQGLLEARRMVKAALEGMGKPAGTYVELKNEDTGTRWRS